MTKKTVMIALLTCMTNAHSTCYILRDHNGQVLYSDTRPPFDLSTPPESAALIAAKKAGQRLQILPDECPSNFNVNGQMNRYVESMSELRPKPPPDAAATMAIRMFNQDREKEAIHNEIKAFDREIGRYRRGVLGDVKRYNDKHEYLYPND